MHNKRTTQHNPRKIVLSPINTKRRSSDFDNSDFNKSKKINGDIGDNLREKEGNSRTRTTKNFPKNPELDPINKESKKIRKQNTNMTFHVYSNRVIEKFEEKREMDEKAAEAVNSMKAYISVVKIAKEIYTTIEKYADTIKKDPHGSNDNIINETQVKMEIKDY